MEFYSTTKTASTIAAVNPKSDPEGCDESHALLDHVLIQRSGVTVSSTVTVQARLWAKEAWVALVRGMSRYPASTRFDIIGHKNTRESSFINTYARRYDEGTAIKWLKFHTSYVFAYAMGQTELPVAPSLVEGEHPGCFVSGAFGRALQEVMRRGRGGSWPHRRCAYDLLMCKYGMPAAPDAFVAQAMVDHRKALCYLRPEETLQETEILTKIEEKISEIVRSVFTNVSYRHLDVLPSLRGCFENNLGDGGSLGELALGFSRDVLDKLPVTEFALSPDRLFGMVYDGRKVHELRFVDQYETVCRFQSYIDEQWNSRLSEPLEATPCAILEPLKVRMITKGQAAEYYRAIEFQRMMHGALRRHPVFEYIGHPIDDESWSKCFGSLEDLPADMFYISGDYKAATDNLRPDLSLFAWKSICGTVRAPGYLFLEGTPYARLGAKCLTGHSLHYPGELSGCQQEWGQLMGSPMSFPILCIVNLAATLAALQMRFSDDLPIKVNGDDICFVATQEQYDTWKIFVKACGLEPSLGKNYASREFAIMNSELRRPPVRSKELYSVRALEYVGDRSDPDDPERCLIAYEPRWTPWSLEGFLNQSILYNHVKKGIDAGSTKTVYWPELSSLSYEVMRGIPSKDQWRFYGIFEKTYKRTIDSMPYECNKWFPKHLGGAGLCRPSGRSLEVLTSNQADSVRGRKTLLDQRKQAAFLACNPKVRLGLNFTPPSTGGEFNVILSSILRLSDSQVPKVIANKPLNREQHVMVGGTTLLGYLLCFVHMSDAAASGDPLGGSREPSASNDESFEKINWAIKKAYFRSLNAARHTSLSPMRLDHIAEYQEHSRLYSHIELLREHAVARTF